MPSKNPTTSKLANVSAHSQPSATGIAVSARTMSPVFFAPMVSVSQPNGSRSKPPPSSGTAVSRPFCAAVNLSSAAMELPNPPSSSQHIEQTQKQRNAPNSVGR